MLLLLFFIFLLCRVCKPSHIGLQPPRGSAKPRCRSEVTLAGLQTLGAQVCRLARLSLQPYHATPNKFVILRCRVCRSKGAGVKPGAWGLQPHQTVQFTVKSFIIYNNSLYNIKQCNLQWKHLQSTVIMSTIKHWSILVIIN